MRFARDHHWAPGHMSAYLDGELTSRGRARMERHSGRCEECRGTLESLRRMLGMLGRLPPPGTGAEGPEIAAAVRRRLHEPPCG
ncbi:MAG TPA: zf-HC2 domain-containing protein [Acidimicrobiales bacterium]|jgi:anti-sigma factor RsiW|nr:zf-HC2 domain-containing protein [Acidimicrobiales bacterium]